MCNYFFSWPIVGILVPGLLFFGCWAMSLASPLFRLGTLCFCLAAAIFLVKFGTWIVTVPLSRHYRVFVTFIIFGFVGIGLVELLCWVESTEKNFILAQKNQEGKEAKQAYTGRLQTGHKIIFSGNENIYPKLEIGDSGTIFEWAGPKNVPMMSFAKDNNITIEIEEGQVKLSTIIRDKNGQIVAEIIKNEWKISKPETGKIWDRNYSKDAFEVLDPNGEVTLQVKLIEDRVQFQAKMYDSSGHRWAFAKGYDSNGRSGAIISPTDTLIIKPIFKYPSELHLGQFVDIQ